MSVADSIDNDPVENDGPAVSKVERIKAASNHLRGEIASELAAPGEQFSEDSAQLLKFHGVYQQDDRDRRKEGKVYIMMVRGRIPGGVMTAKQYGCI